MPVAMTANMPDSRAPLLFFDSGMGGLSVLSEAQKLLPLAPVVYVSDHAAFPYGTKAESEIATRVPVLLGKLAERYRPRLITIACNTASTIALDSVRQVLDIPVVGTVPAIKPAAELTETGVIGLLGTRATVRQGYIDVLAEKFAQGIELIRYGDPQLASAAEAVMRGEQVGDAVFRNAMQGLLAQPRGEQVDTVILGCTHFPLVLERLAQFGKSGMRFVDGNAGIARRIAYLTRGQAWPENKIVGKFVTTGKAGDIEPYKDILRTYGLETLEYI